MTETSWIWAAGIVNHGGYEDLEACIESLARQSCPPANVFVYDTGVDSEKFESLRTAYPQVLFEAGPNVGYAGGANRVVERLRDDTQPSFILVLNPDVALDADFAERLIGSVVQAPRVAIATGKLLRPDRKTLDSAGIVFPRHRRPRDRGSEELDRGQYDRAEAVDAVSGAAMLLRVADLDALALDGELFDERFFAYHEDTDLCWRARRFGYEILYEPAAVATHGRGWQRSGRTAIPVAIRRHSFKNHYLQVVKNETVAGFLGHAPDLIVWEILRLGFVVLRERDLFGAYRAAWCEIPEARRKRRLIRARVRGGSGPGGTPSH
jgi:GT2 family glycosyltransferase